MINELPTIFEVVSGNVKQPKDQSATHNNSGKSKSSGKMVRSYELHLILSDTPFSMLFCLQFLLLFECGL
jgi:hypothetical protein